jgi:hypothetical protein
MKLNPVLARNVVMLAMRHAIEDLMGGGLPAESGLHRQTYYHLALTDFRGPQACTDPLFAGAKLGELFPSWPFEYRVTGIQKENDAKLKDCPEESLPSMDGDVYRPGYGSGVALSFGDFYVAVPTPSVLASGVFEQTDSLRRALAYRDRISQAIIDRSVLSTVKAIAGNGADAEDIVRTTAFALLNEGWEWKNRKKPN